MAQLDSDKIVALFNEVEKRLYRARLPFDVPGDLQNHKAVSDVSVYEIIKSIRTLTEIARELNPEKFGIKVQEVRKLITPELDVHQLDLCPYCGDPTCTSDHK